MGFSLFIDFDGTIAVQDVGNRLFTAFSGGRNYDIVERWKRREVTSVVCLTKEAELISASRSELVDFVSQFEIDEGFGGLCDLCRENDIPVMVISDGLDLYIHAILDRHGFGDIPVMSNRAVFENGRLRIEFPQLDHSCGFCGNCKGSAIRRLTRDVDKSIFIGDGYSDLCAIDVSDYLFAKADLANYLAQSGREFIPYENLCDVTERIRRKILAD